MSATAETIQSKPASEPRSSWALLLGQITTIMRLDVKRNFFGKRAVLIYLLALMPIGLLSLMAILPPGFAWADFTQYPLRFSLIYNALILRTVVFFGCAWIFMNLFRGEIVDRSLHYYFLSAVRAIFFGRCGNRPAGYLRRHHYIGVRWLRRVLYGGWFVLSQSNNSRP